MSQHGSRGVRVRTVNIVATTGLKPPFSLEPLLSTYPFDSEQFLNYIIVPSQRSLFRIFTTGKVVSLTAKSIPDLEASLAWLRALLAGFGLTLLDFYEISNIVGVAQIAPPLDLMCLVRYLPRASYEPSHDFGPTSFEHLLNAITYYFQPPSIKPRQTALIFRTGRATFTGFKSLPKLRAAARHLSREIADIIRCHPEVLISEGVIFPFKKIAIPAEVKT